MCEDSGLNGVEPERNEHTNSVYYQIREHLCLPPSPLPVRVDVITNIHQRNELLYYLRCLLAIISSFCFVSKIINGNKNFNKTNLELFLSFVENFIINCRNDC